MDSSKWAGYLVVLIVGVGIGYMLHTPPQATSTNTNAMSEDVGSTANATTTKSFALVVKDKKVVDGSGDITVTQGDTVVLTVTNDTDEELHLHGYNLMTDLKAGVAGSISFQATASGRFPFELEGSKTDLGAISVEPK